MSDDLPERERMTDQEHDRDRAPFDTVAYTLMLLGLMLIAVWVLFALTGIAAFAWQGLAFGGFLIFAGVAIWLYGPYR